MVVSSITLGQLRFDRGHALAEFGDVIEAPYICSDRIDTRFELAAQRTKALLHLLWNGIDTPIHSIQALVNAIQTVVNSIQTSIDSIQAGFDMRQALAYVRELRRQPGLERGADRADSNLLSLFNALYRHAVSSLRKSIVAERLFTFEPG